MRWEAVPYSILFPGLGHTSLGRSGLGMALSVSFGLGVLFAAWHGAAAESPWLDDAFLGWALFSASVYVFALFDASLAVLRAARGRNSPIVEGHLRTGMLAAAQGDDAQAEREFRRVLAINPADPEALLHLGTLYARQGKKRKARSHLRRCARFDPNGKWDWEVEREMERAARASA